MIHQYLLGIDIGTTGTKTMLFSEDGKLTGRAYQPYPMSTPRVSYSEQDAEDWWRAVVHTVREVCREPEIASHVAAISLSLQGGTLVVTDSGFRPLRPAIVWNDGRCVQEREAFLREVGGAGVMYRKTGWGLSCGLPLLELRWLKEHEPEVLEKAAWYLSVPDFISARMTGIPAVDLSNAGINQLLNLQQGVYDEELLRFADIPMEKLGRLVRSGDVIGRLTESAASELGLSPETLLVAGAHDQYAVALGAGAVHSGDILVGSGTCWVVTAIGDGPDFASGLSQSVAAVPGKWGSLRSLSSGGVCLDWWRRLAGGPDGLPYGVISREAAERRAAEDGLFFFPFSGQAGEGRKFSRASFAGLDLSHDQFSIARAIMEGVAFQTVWMIESFKTKPSREGLKLTGGAAKSEFWCQLTADISGLPVRVPGAPDLACAGAAVLAGTGCGIFRDAAEGCKCLSIGERVLRPDPVRAGRYRELFADYKRAASALGAVYGI